MLERYSRFWDGSEPGWCLVKCSSDDRSTIFNAATRMALAIEDELEHQRVCAEMLSRGAPVLSRILPGNFEPQE